MKSDSPIRVVIAEDEYLISLDIVNATQSAGFEVVGVASDGEQVLKLIEEHTPDIAMLDIQMPKMNGLEAARRIWDQFHLPVIIMTAYESREFLIEARDASVGAYLVKPPKPEEIRRAIEIARARHEDLMELCRVNTELRDAFDRIKTLEGFITICSYCKKIHDSNESWQQLEQYISNNTDAVFSHGICPECFEEKRWDK